MRKLLTMIGLLLLPAAAWADREITPTLGYRSGTLGTTSGVGCIAIVPIDCPTLAESEDSIAFGAIADLPLGDRLDLELLVSRQPTSLEFRDTVSGKIPQPRFGESDFDLSHLQAGLRRTWEVGSLRPYGAFGLGLAWLKSERLLNGSDVDNVRASASLAAGLRVDLTRRLGVRVETRGYWIDLPESFAPGMDVVGDDNLTQLDATTGLTVKF